MEASAPVPKMEPKTRERIAVLPLPRQTRGLMSMVYVELLVGFISCYSSTLRWRRERFVNCSCTVWTPDHSLNTKGRMPFFDRARMAALVSSRRR